MTIGSFVDIDKLEADDRSDLLDKATPVEGILVTCGPKSAQIILEAFPREGYSLGDAEELRDLILKFNKEHFLAPTVL